MKKLFLLAFILTSYTIISQRKYSKEFRFITDNDLYISTTQDRYYTNGMFFSYRFLGTAKNASISKKAYQLEIGHHIYTPFVPTVPHISLHDRPFAGYVYAGFGIEYFYKKGSVLKLQGKVGVIGPAALGKEIMKIVHSIYGLRDAVGWKYQIKNAFAIDFEATYIKPLFTEKQNYFDVSWYNNANIGTTFTYLTTGVYGRIGLIPLQKIINSIAFGGNLNNNTTGLDNKAEVFLYFQPTVSFIGYDATIQGSIFTHNNPVTFPINYIKFEGEFGIKFTANRFNFGYSIHLHSKKLKSIRVPNTNFYGSIKLAYQFN